MERMEKVFDLLWEATVLKQAVFEERIHITLSIPVGIVRTPEGEELTNFLVSSFSKFDKIIRFSSFGKMIATGHQLFPADPLSPVERTIQFREKNYSSHHYDILDITLERIEQ